MEPSSQQRCSAPGYGCFRGLPEAGDQRIFLMIVIERGCSHWTVFACYFLGGEFFSFSQMSSCTVGFCL